jgi:hypothetical protein
MHAVYDYRYGGSNGWVVCTMRAAECAAMRVAISSIHFVPHCGHQEVLLQESQTCLVMNRYQSANVQYLEFLFLENLYLALQTVNWTSLSDSRKICGTKGGLTRMRTSVWYNDRVRRASM